MGGFFEKKMVQKTGENRKKARGSRENGCGNEVFGETPNTARRRRALLPELFSAE